MTNVGCRSKNDVNQMSNAKHAKSHPTRLTERTKITTKYKMLTKEINNFS